MASSLGTIKGQMILDVKQALASYTAVRLAHLSTVTALATGGAALAGAGAIVAGAGIAMGAGILYAVNAAAEFERKLDYFGAVSGATQGEMEAIRAKALQLGQDTIYSAGQIADSFVELGKAGVGSKDIIDGIGEAVANLGAAADIPLDTAANIIMAAVQTFGLSAQHAVGVADQLAGAANASIVDVQDLGTSLKYAGGTASALGLPIEDVITSLGILGQAGIKGSTAGTSLRQMLVSLSGATGPATKKLKELGIITEDGSNKFFTAEGKAKPLGEIFQVLQDATAGLTDAQKVQALKQIFQNRAMSSALALTKAGTAGFEEMSAAIGDVTAMDVATRRLDNLSGDIEILRGNLETLAIEAGSTMQEFARGIVQGITEVVGWFANLDSGTQKTILMVASFIAIGLTLVGFLGVFAGAVLNIIALFMKLGPAITLIKTLLTALRTSFIATWIAALGPIGLIIAAVVAVVAIFILLWNNCEGFRNFFIALWGHIVNAAKAAWAWFLNLGPWFANLWNTIVTWATNTWNSFITWIGAIPGRISAFFAGIGEWFSNLWTSITTWATTAWNNWLTWMAALPGKIVAFFVALPGMIGYAIGFVIGVIANAFIQSWIWLNTTLPEIIASVVDWFAQLPGRIGAWLSVMWNNVVTWFTNTWNSAVDLAGRIFNGVVDWLKQLPGRVKQFFVDLYNNVKNQLIQAAAQSVILAIQIYQNIINWLQQLPGRVREFFQNLVDNVRDRLNSARETAANIAHNIVSAIIDTITSLPGKVADILGNVIQAFKDVVSSAFNAAKNFASGLWEGFKDGLGIHSPSFIEHAMWAITDTVDDETHRLEKQVVSIQRLGQNLNHIGTETGSGFAAGVAGVANTMASEIQKAKQLQQEMASMQVQSTMSNRLAYQAATQASAQERLAAAKNAAAAAGGNTYSFGDITLEAKDLREVQTVLDFVNVLERKARQKAGSK